MNGHEVEKLATSVSAQMKVNGFREDMKISKSISKLREEKAELESRLKVVEGYLEISLDLKTSLSRLTQQLRGWTERIQAANRSNQGVPLLGDIKKVCNEILAEVRKEDFQKRYQSMVEAGIPCFSQVSDGMNGLQRVCSKVLQNEANYNALWVEEMRQIIGRLIGSTNAVLELHFEE